MTSAQITDVPAAASASASQLSAVDANFVAQANLGAPFQIDSGRLAEKKGTTDAIRDYAHLMVVSHIPVVNALNAVSSARRWPHRRTRCCTALMTRWSPRSKPNAAPPSTATMSMGKSNIRKETLRYSNMRSRTGRTRTLRSSRAKPCRRSKIIYTGRSPWQKDSSDRKIGGRGRRAASRTAKSKRDAGKSRVASAAHSLSGTTRRAFSGIQNPEP
jgi:Domain of unknown function (DUF4142)